MAEEKNLEEKSKDFIRINLIDIRKGDIYCFLPNRSWGVFENEKDIALEVANPSNYAVYTKELDGRMDWKGY